MVTPSAKYSSEASEANLAENINKNFSSRVNETEKSFKHGLDYPPNPLYTSNPLNPSNLLNLSNSSPNPPSPCSHYPNLSFKDSRSNYNDSL